ncbi:peptidase S8/S53 domain-containing protein [Polychytrium aggregatum]|uniref:peptidase S8/S53 domain-containing protein n=1 Tax=Polychytrium aggregatum TaxID=110093 RepID=UPI0022FDB886|nr:peptidase S8/S53 domain-containing protein [Polychytrium aggregatum]KAI9203335.1 peptidase S8/S53 domain-containing protein [Polychytrium aggregatum]
MLVKSMLLASALLASSVNAQANWFPALPSESRPVIPNTYMIELKPGASFTPGSAVSSFASSDSPVFTTTVRTTVDTPLFNGVSIQVTGDHTVDDILNIPDAVNVWPVRSVPALKPVATYSVPPSQDWQHTLTGVNKVHEELGLTGKGIKVAIIDSGVYYKHAALGGGFGPGYKVAYGYDLVGDNYGAANSTVVPDPDPIDNCSTESHGTHVAGIVGGNATASLTGEFAPPLPFVGVAPGATLGAYRVFGCPADNTGTDIITAAIYRAHQDGSDIISLSLGGGPTFNTDVDSVAATRVGQQGSIVVAALGNDGGHGLFVPSSPGIAAGGFGIASFDGAQALSEVIYLPDGTPVAYTPSALGGGWNHTVAQIVPNNATAFGDDSNLGDACTYVNPAVKGNVAFVAFPPAGSACGSVSRCLNVFKAGAIGCLAYFNDGSGSINGNAALPGGAITGVDAKKIFAALATNANAQFTFSSDIQAFPQLTAGTVSSFSSGGIGAELEIKPDIGAPGGRILSTISQFAAQTSKSVMNDYAVYDGTSMATPYFSGSIALFLEGYRKNGKTGPKFEDVRTAFQNNAKVTLAYNTTLPNTVGLQGSGLVNVYQAITNNFLTVSPSRVTLKDGYLSQTKTFTLTITNTGDKKTAVTLSHLPAALINNVQQGDDQLIESIQYADQAATALFRGLPSDNTVTIPPHGSKKIQVVIKPPAGADANALPVYSGYIQFKSCQDESIVSVPYAGVVGHVEKASVLVKTSAFDTTALLDPNTGNVVTDTVTVNATSTGIISRVATAFTSHNVVVDVVYAEKSKHPAKNDLSKLFHDSLGYAILYDLSTFNPSTVSGERGRNTRTKGQSVVTSSMGIWAGGIVPSLSSVNITQLPAGSYKLRVSAVRVFGNQNHTSSYQQWESPVLNIVY